MSSVRETICTNCVHCEVCRYKEKYLEAVKAIQNVGVDFDSGDGKVAMQKISMIDFITLRDPDCKFFSQRYTQFQRSSGQIFTKECMDNGRDL